MTITPPTVHTNGTNSETLVEGYKDAREALMDAHHAVRHTAPNGRDFYVQGDGAFTKAQAEHYARLKIIENMREEFLALAEAVMDQSAG